MQRRKPKVAPPVASHILHLYEGNERVLTAGVGRYLADGAQRGDGLLVVATAAHAGAFRKELRRLGVPVRLAEKKGWLCFADAHELLACFMVDGYPDWKQFSANAGSYVAETSAAAAGNGLRVYGEMVGILWQAKQYPSAIRVEQLWNRLRKAMPCDLYCAYPIDIFDKQFEMGIVDALLCSHSALVPAERSDDLSRAVGRAIHEVLKTREELLRPFMADVRVRAWGTVPRAEGTILWLRANVPDHADEILSRARAYYYGRKAAPVPSG